MATRRLTAEDAARLRRRAAARKAAQSAPTRRVRRASEIEARPVPRRRPSATTRSAMSEAQRRQAAKRAAYARYLRMKKRAQEEEEKVVKKDEEQEKVVEEKPVEEPEKEEKPVEEPEKKNEMEKEEGCDKRSAAAARARARRAARRRAMRRKANEVSDDLKDVDGDSSNIEEIKKPEEVSDDLTEGKADDQTYQEPPASADEAADKVIAAYALIDAQVAQKVIPAAARKAALAGEYCKKYTINEMKFAAEQLSKVGAAGKQASEEKKNVRVSRRSGITAGKSTSTGYEDQCMFL